MTDLVSMITVIVTFCSSWIPLKPRNIKYWLTVPITFITFVIGFEYKGVPVITAFLNLLLQLPVRLLFYAACILLAWVPSYAASKEGLRAAKPSYVAGNRKYNLSGVACLIVAVEVTSQTIQNTIFLKIFAPLEIIKGLIPLSLWIALSYQYQEQRKESELDHSPSLEWKNQILNVLHLIHTYFWSFLFGILLICYTLYCHIHHIPLRLNLFHLLAFSVIPVFFYVIALESHTYLYRLFLATIPALLIYGIQWQSWSVLGPVMFYIRAAFFAFHYIVYTFVVLSKEKPTSRLAVGAAGLAAACIFFCCISPSPIWLTPGFIGAYDIIFALAELYFVFQKKPVSYQLSLILIPAFLICMVYWESSLVTTRNIAYLQSISVIVHLALYMLIIFCHIKFPNTGKHKRKAAMYSRARLSAFLHKFKKDPSEIEEKAKEKLGEKLILGDYFFAIVFAVILFAYPIFSTLPFKMEQTDYHTAVNHINALCDDQNLADALQSDIRSSPWYTDDPMLVNPEIDQAQYLIFMFENLRQEMVNHGVISSDSTDVTMNELLTWYSSRP